MTRKLVVAAALAIAIAGIVLARSPTVATTIATAADWARGAGALGVAAFVATYVIATVALLPGSVLTIAAGFTYGLGWGVVLVIPTAVISATVAFVVGRVFARERVTRRFGGGRRFQAIDAAVERRGALVVGLLRLSPVFPFVVLNYLLSITKVNTRAYIAASALGMLPGTFLYVYLGSLAGTATEAASGGGGPGALRFAMLAAGLVATILVVVIVTRLARRELASTVS